MNSRFKLVVVTSSTMLVALLLLGAAMGRSASPEDAYRHLAVYTEVLSRIKSEYVEEPDIKNVTLGAMNGMLEAIDPFASYLSAEQYKQYLKSYEAKKPNPGLVLSRRFGYVGVVNAVPGSPAAKAGLSTGDMLESINGVATRDMPLAYAEMLLQGEPGTNVDVSVLRVRKPEPQKITLTRAVNRLPAVTSRMLSDGIGLVQVPVVDAQHVKDTAGQIADLQKQGAKKLIMDLRYSGFGRPEDGVDLANLFIEKGLITYSEGQKVKRQDFHADPAKATFKSLPLVVLTNRGTSNGAEIAAAALLNSKRAQVVGERSYGDAAIRRPVTMDDGSAVILSVAKFYSPGGKAIQDDYVMPNVLVQETDLGGDEDEDPATPAPEPKKDEDEILKKAIGVFTGDTTQSTSTTGNAAAPVAPAAPAADRKAVEETPLVDKNQKK